jgi:ATP-dependent DNA helicase RecG
MLLKKETTHIEYKASFNDEAIESLVAFANTKGGAVHIGVKDNGKITGVVLGKETVAGWINEIKTKTVPSIVPNVDIVNKENKDIVILTVTEYPVKPLSMKGRYYKRVENSNHLLSPQEIVNLSLQSRQLSWDSYPYPGASFDDLNTDKIKQFILKVNLIGRFTLPDSPMDALNKLGMMEDGVPTNAAMILFSKANLRYNVHIGRFKTPDMIIADKMINGNLYDVVEESMQTIIGHLKFAFEIKGRSTQRTEIPEYPLEAVREMLLNSVIHRDYQSPTDVQIKIFDNSISFFNPSGLYGSITEEDLKTDNYRASTRNRQIAEAFYLTKDIEKYGSGFLRIRRELVNYPTMVFSYRNAGYGFFSDLSYTVQKTSTEKFGEKFGEKKTNKKKILAVIKEKPEITIIELSEIIGISSRGIEKNLSLLKKEGAIKRIGTDKTGHWEVLKEE